MNLLKTLCAALLMMASTWVAPTWVAPAFAADEEHMHGDMHGGRHAETGMGKSMDSENKGMPGMFMSTKDIDGYTVTFHVMKASAGTKNDGSHHLMIKVEQGGSAVPGLIANSKVIHPDGKEESRKLMQMGDWTMAGYDLGHEGKYQLMVLFKTSEGKKHFGGVFFP
ncbi:MAG: hypothetical protein OEZ32_05300 [Nitrospinota bacterium]|nr:hypothetical protein [Nitrospinota bacterium]